VFGHLEGSYNPELVVVVVQKRIRTRMFCSEVRVRFCLVGGQDQDPPSPEPPFRVIRHSLSSSWIIKKKKKKVHGQSKLPIFTPCSLAGIPCTPYLLTSTHSPDTPLYRVMRREAVYSMHHQALS